MLTTSEVVLHVHVKFLVGHVATPVDVASLVHSGECAPTNDVVLVKLELLVDYDDVGL